MKIGIFGGTFDPVHQGHLLIAEQCREQAHLEQVWFVPSFQPPHKQPGSITPYEQRVEMLRLALAGAEATFPVSLIEHDLKGPSYTVNMVAALKKANPNVEWQLILGADCLPDLPQWYEPKRLIQEVGLLVTSRPNAPRPDRVEVAKALGIVSPTEIRWQEVRMPLMEISSRDIRQRVQSDRSIRFMLPKSVEDFIWERRLYRN